MYASISLVVTLVNNSSEEHDFVIQELDYHLHTMPGSTNKESITFTEAGTYEAICTIPGHKEAGMVATIQVTE
ncbi:plastocyanin/azurin family copper-binding protein [Halalkalibacter lacteus]|uniref:plastocyanin/azurin family copper-binding protein n=1 Tax=Halalkalibacter lacteus TaxID=3090663 RepID=UPI002FC72FAE